MIYTIGIRLKYERRFREGQARKRGRGPNADGTIYPGGFAFETEDAARRFLAAKGLAGTHIVMGVVADWDKDTVALEGQPYRHLTRDANLVKL